jgi:hypothetical protein
MKPVRLLFLAAMSACAIFGASISSGVVTVQGALPRGEFTLTGENSPSFILGGFIGDGNFPLGNYVGPGEEASFDLSGETGGNDVHITSAVLNGVPRTDLWFVANLDFTSETVMVNAAGSYTAPFTFVGFFGGHETQEFDNCLICPPGEDTIPIFGRGIATLEVVPDVDGLVRTDTLTYQFIPEPGTMWLLLSGAVLAAAWRIVRTRQFRRVPWL